MAEKILSIVIGTYNRIDVLRQCLDALIENVRVPHEIFVVDAGSTDGTLEYLRSRQGIHLVCDDKLIGQAQSLNRVFKRLNSKYVCWLSDDNIVQPGMLDQAVSILMRDPAIGMVSLKVKDVSGPLKDQEYLGGIWPTGILNCNQGMLPLNLLIRIGGFDEHFQDYGIDGDLTTRILLEGYKVVYTKQIAIYHLRDHDTESWVDSDGRKQKLENAKLQYRQKFEALIKCEVGGRYNRPQRYKSSRLKKILRLYGRAKEKGISIEKWVGLVERDWVNLFVARFVSKWDFLINIAKPYYLVQSIPSGLLREIVVNSPDNEPATIKVG